MNPLIGGALIGAGSSLLGSIFGSHSNSSTNAQNLLIARETNALQQRMFNQQLAWNLDMWHKNNQYNSPSEQVQRLKAAGLNPYLMMSGQGGIGQSSGPASGVNPPQMHAAQMQSYDPSGSFNSAGGIAADAQLKSSQVENVREDTKQKSIDNQTRHLKNLKEIDKLVAESKNSHTKAALQQQQWELLRATWDDTLRQAHLQNESLETDIKLKSATILGVQLDNKMKDLNLKYLPETLASQIAKTWSDIDVNRSVIGLNQASVSKLAQDVIESQARTNGINLSNSQVEQLTPLLVKEKKWQIIQTKHNSGAQSWVQYYQDMPDWLRRGVEFGAGFVGAGKVATGIKAVKGLKGVKAIKGFF